MSTSPNNYGTITPQIRGLIEDIIGKENTSTLPEDLEKHAVDESPLEPHPPHLVVKPSSTGEVQKIIDHYDLNDILNIVDHLMVARKTAQDKLTEFFYEDLAMERLDVLSSVSTTISGPSNVLVTVLFVKLISITGLKKQGINLYAQ